MARFRAHLSRTGRQLYTEGWQHRSAADVFDPQSLAGLDGLRVQRGHDPNAPAVGRVVPGTVGRADIAGGESHVTAVLEITDIVTVADIRTGHLREISLA